MTQTEVPRPAAARRRWLMAGAAAVAAVAGAAVGWRQLGGADSTAQALWGLTFETPGGETLALQSLKGRPLLINFWATWCPPCVEELPLLDRFYKEKSSKSWQVIGLAIDQPTAVRKFLAATPVSFPIGMAGLGGTELGKSLGNITGGLPFTIVVDSKGGVAQRKMGRLTPQDLQAWAGLA